MVTTILDVFLANTLYSPDNQCHVVILDQAHELLCSQCLELLFDLAEHQLNWIPLGAVAHIVDELEAEIPHMFLGLVRCVGRQLIHEQAYLVVTVGSPKLCEILFELDNVHRPLKHLKMLLALLPRNG